MAKVLILQHRLLHYRVRFFEELHSICAEKGIDLHVLHGQPTRREEKKRDIGYLPWADVVSNRYLSLGGKDILWQPFPSHLRDADLVILMQENRLLSNYPWLFSRRRVEGPKIAYWGHGRNFQSSSPTGILERWKKLLIGRVDWWFAYTELTKQILLADGYPDERITVLNNAIDNEGFNSDLASVGCDQLRELRETLGLNENSRIGLFCGSLYPDKRLDYLIDACDAVKRRFIDFHLIIIGDGPSAADIIRAEETRPWLHWVGVKKGKEKALYFKLAHLVLNPGLVGLHVLDSFCAGVPMVTTVDALHSPEIAYLADGENGLVVRGGADTYANAVVDLFGNPQQYDNLREGALVSSQCYTLQNMLNNFAGGIERCLSSGKKL